MPLCPNFESRINHAASPYVVNFQGRKFQPERLHRDTAKELSRMRVHGNNKRAQMPGPMAKMYGLGLGGWGEGTQARGDLVELCCQESVSC